MRFLFLIFSISFLSISCRYSEQNQNEVGKNKDVPLEAIQTLEYILKYNKAPQGYVGGRKFGNYENRLPKNTDSGKSIYYKEWDIYPKTKGKNRGPHRLVTGNNKTAYYTADHYDSFIELETDQ